MGKLQFQISTDYAIRIIGYMSMKKDELIVAKEMSDNLGITYQYLMKILNTLKKGELIRSIQGRNGGYQLNKDPKKISVYDIITVLKDKIRINRCLEEDHFCSRHAVGSCEVHDFFEEIQATMIDALKDKKITDLFHPE